MTVTGFELYGGRETDKSALLQLSAETTNFTIENGYLKYINWYKNFWKNTG